MMIWQLLAIVFGVTTFAASALAIWKLIDRNRLRRRFAGIIDLEREILARRHAFNQELARRQVLFDSEIAVRRRAIESELAKHTAAIEVARRNATSATN